MNGPIFMVALQDQNRWPSGMGRVVLDLNCGSETIDNFIEQNSIGCELSIAMPRNFDLTSRDEQPNAGQSLAHAAQPYSAAAARLPPAALRRRSMTCLRYCPV